MGLVMENDDACSTEGNTDVLQHRLTDKCEAAAARRRIMGGCVVHQLALRIADVPVLRAARGRTQADIVATRPSLDSELRPVAGLSDLDTLCANADLAATITD